MIPDDAPLHDWAGLVQRVLVLGLLFPARLALSYRLLRITAVVTGAASRASAAAMKYSVNEQVDLLFGSCDQ